MCGICGFNWEDKNIINLMAEQVSHRGPDQLNTYTDSGISFGHTRLKIIDLSDKGKQPMSNEDGDIWIVYNGEIYNFKELKQDLEKKGHKFKSASDTEVIVHAYEEYGSKCLALLDGMFSFAIWDSKKKELLLARDRLGIKPLFFYYDGKNFIFASEIKSILKNDLFIPKLNLTAFNELMYYGYTIDEKTLLEGVKELLPGHCLVLNGVSVLISRYWNFDVYVGNNNLGYYTKKLRKLIEESVEKRLMSDVPLGASLSGGLDSSVIVAVMSKLNNDPINTFTVGFGSSADEFLESKIVAEHCQTKHKEILVNYDDLDKNLNNIVWHMEIPFSKPAVFPTYFLSQTMKKHITVALVGDGADEVFAGYNRYIQFVKGGVVSDEDLKSVLSGNFQNNDNSSIYTDKSIAGKISNVPQPLKNLQNFSSTENGEILNHILVFEQNTQLPKVQLTRTDRMSMAHAVEMRVPFLDHKIVEFSRTIPWHFKWKGNTKKYILQKAFSDFLPKEIVSREKFPFGMPLNEYFKSNLSSIAEEVLMSNKAKKRGYIKQENLLNLINKLKTQKNPSDSSLRKILFLTSFEIWLRLFVDKGNVGN
jgi:asparagine synthase (glutamine-hydrolysing)